MLSGFTAATHYGYSSARVKAMSANLVKSRTMQDIMNAKDINTILGILSKGDYKKEIEEFGGLEIKNELIDFALSKNLAKQVTKLVDVSPTTERKIIRAIVGKWDLYNIKLAIEAKDRRADYESIARYVIDSGRYNSSALKEAMREESIEGLLNKFMINSPYVEILKSAVEAYRKSKNAIETIATIDKSYYNSLGRAILELRTIDMESARIIKLEIDMKNLLTLIRGKRLNMKFNDFHESLIELGNLNLNELEQVYNNSKDVEALLSQVKSMDLKNAIETYRNSKQKQLLIFEIGMKNAILNESIKLLKHRILSFGTMLAYSYSKELEIYTIRILINSRIYGLGKEDVNRLMVWKGE